MNQGINLTDWLMVVITAIYVVATIVICYFNGKSANAAKRQTDEMIRQSQLANRPHVTIHFDVVRNGLMCFVVENEGPVPASNIKISFNEAFLACISDDRDREHLKQLASANMYLASKQRIFLCLGGQTDFEQISKNVAEIDISYDSYHEHTTIDLQQYGILLLYESPESDIAQHIKSIKEQNKTFYSNILKKIDSHATIQNVVLHNETEDEAKKFRIYKQVCMGNGQSAAAIADTLGYENEIVWDLLLELNKVDKLIYRTMEQPEDKFEIKWYRY